MSLNLGFGNFQYSNCDDHDDEAVSRVIIVVTISISRTIVNHFVSTFFSFGNGSINLHHC